MAISPSSGLNPESMRRLAGFGMLEHGDSYVFRPWNEAEIPEIFNLARKRGRRVVLRGMGRSYGDASVAQEAIALDIRRMNRVLDWNPESGILRIEAGATIEEVWRYVIEDGYWPPVVPGTMKPTLAGALAMNVHGKNNLHNGTLGEHVVSLRFLTPDGKFHHVTPSHPWLRAIVGGWGLLGVITEVELKLQALDSGNLSVLNRSISNWSEQFESFQSEEDADYSVSWVDGFGQGRGIFQAARHIPGPESTSLTGAYQDLGPEMTGGIPKYRAWKYLRRFTNRSGMRMLSAARYRASAVLGAERTKSMPLVAFQFPLDYIPDWQRAYQPGGLRQFQAAVPKELAPEIFAEQLRMCRLDKLEPYLVVMKRHRPDPFLLPYLCDGYSLALDFHQTDRNESRLRALFRSMTKCVLDSGGKFYLAKDAWLNPAEAERSVGKEAMEAFKELRSSLDPEMLLTSDLGRRIGLCP